MRPYATVTKRIGETPLEAIERYRSTALLKEDVPLAYAGRLDPMAEGVLLVLIGDECKRQEKYHGLDKEYEFEILFGFSSDTGDVLGLATEQSGPEIDRGTIQKAVKKFMGEVTFPYPKFSSKTVQGKPLHVWTLENKLHEIEIPEKTSRIYSLSLVRTQKLERKELRRQIFEKIDSIPEVTDPRKALGADFRRVAIRARWNELFEKTQHAEFEIARFKCVCSSGTYMRTLAEAIAKELGTGGLAFSIRRTIIGRYTEVPFFGYWSKRYQ